jgi:hypothetical protein
MPITYAELREALRWSGGSRALFTNALHTRRRRAGPPQPVLPRLPSAGEPLKAER